MYFIFLFIGYKPFVEACIDAGEKSEALKYIPKLTDPREKSEVHLPLIFNLIENIANIFADFFVFWSLMLF